MPRFESRNIKGLQSHIRGEERRGLGKGQLLNSGISGFRPEDLRRDYQDYLRSFEGVSKQPNHNFPLHDDPSHADLTLAGAADHVNLLYTESKGAAYGFLDRYREIMDHNRPEGEQIDPSIVDLMKTSHVTLTSGYGLVNNLERLVDARPSLMVTKQLPSRLRVQIMQVQEEIGTDKPPEFTEAYRKFIPRWMVHDIPFPEDDSGWIVPASTERPWGEFTEKDAHYLISPDKIAEGKAPLHVVLKKADEAVAQGDADQGYALRIWGITHVMAAERQHREGEHAELPLFTNMVGGLMADERQPASRNAHYDYGAAVDSTMRETFRRLPEEMRTGEDGMATTFTDRISNAYGDQFADIAALAITKYDENGAGVDMLPLVRELDTSDKPWAAEVREAIERTGVRRVIRTEEIEQHAQLLPQAELERPDMSDQVMEDTAAIVGDRDVLGFRTQINKMTGLQGPRVDLDLELDKASETVSGLVRVDDDATLRYVPFSMSFYGDKESMQFPSVDETPVSADSIARYHGVVVDALRQHAEKVRRSQPKAPKAKGGALVAPAQSELAVAKLSREDRMSMYAVQKERALRKMRSSRSGGRELAAGEPAVLAPEVDLPEASVRGLDHEHVRDILDEQEITAVSPDKLITRVEAMTEGALLHDKEIGKAVNVESFGPDAADINLRQINWSVGNSSVLLFVEDAGDGSYAFRGATERKGKNQARYITEIVNDIIVERQQI